MMLFVIPDPPSFIFVSLLIYISIPIVLIREIIRSCRERKSRREIEEQRRKRAEWLREQDEWQRKYEEECRSFDRKMEEIRQLPPAEALLRLEELQQRLMDEL